MHSAAVGFHCPECLSEGRRSQPTPRTAFGGTLHGYSAQVTKILIAINAVVYLISISAVNFTNNFGLVGKALPSAHATHLVGVAEGQYYRLVTSMFLHASFLHIAFNMWALWIVGRELEAVLGRTRYLTLYLLSGLGGSALAYLLAPANTVTVGASGAIFGLFGAMAVIGYRMKVDIRGIALVIGINLGITFTFSSVISWQAHVGGLVTGAAIAAAYAYAPRPNRVPVQLTASILVAVAIAAIVWSRTLALTA
jgi:membrane associated rhomboid family serine protease